MQKPYIGPKTAKRSQRYEWCTDEYEGCCECVCHSAVSLLRKEIKMADQARQLDRKYIGKKEGITLGNRRICVKH